MGGVWIFSGTAQWKASPVIPSPSLATHASLCFFYHKTFSLFLPLPILFLTSRLQDFLPSLPLHTDNFVKNHLISYCAEYPASHQLTIMRVVPCLSCSPKICQYEKIVVICSHGRVFRSYLRINRTPLRGTVSFLALDYELFYLLLHLEENIIQ